jgi:hypothetical protein
MINSVARAHDSNVYWSQNAKPVHPSEHVNIRIINNLHLPTKKMHLLTKNASSGGISLARLA